MSQFIGILEKEPTSLWGMWFPDLPGCVTAASNAEECISQATEAVDLWVEDATSDGENLPNPRTLEQLRDDPEVMEALAKGDVAVLIPAAIRVFGLDPAANEALGQRAAEKGLTRIGFVREIILEKLTS